VRETTLILHGELSSSESSGRLLALSVRQKYLDVSSLLASITAAATDARYKYRVRAMPVRLPPVLQRVELIVIIY